MAERPFASEHAYSFGAFRLLRERQLLLEGEQPVRLGSRAFAILVTLIDRAGEVVSKDDIMARVWPHVTVDELNLRVHIAALRKALGDGLPDRRYVMNYPGRGYCFVGAIERHHPTAPQVPNQNQGGTPHNLPPLLIRPVGRQDEIAALARHVSEHRLVTLVGAGGIGKTTVALATAETLLTTYPEGIWFVDLASLNDPQLVPGAVAAILGLTSQAENIIPALIAHLRDRQVLIVLDSCEHCLDAVSALTEQLVGQSHGLRVLATSRERLRAKGEQVRRLQPLAIPPENATRVTAIDALTFPAVQLFVERASASREDFDLTDTDAPIVTRICQKLDGMALAIELAAARVNTFSVQELLTHLDDRLQLWQGRRTALPRHRTLAATLDWSYDALSEDERHVLRRLSVFVGTFTLEAAHAVVAGDEVAYVELVQAVSNLVEKSLISVNVSGAVAKYRLLDTTRAYGRQKLAEYSEFTRFMSRYAKYHRDLFKQAEAEWEVRPTDEWAEDYRYGIDDVRSALDWAFSPDGDTGIGVALTVAVLPLLSHLSLMDECRRRVLSALAGTSDERGRSPRDEMKLYSALAAALLHGSGPLPETDEIWARALEAAEHLADVEYQLRALWGLSAYRIAVGEYRAGLELAERFRAIAHDGGDMAAWLMGGRMTGAALHYLGRETEAQEHLELTVGQYVAPARRSHLSRFQFDQRALAKQTLSSVLWLRGFPEQAVTMAGSALHEAHSIGHGLTLCSVLFSSACTVSLYVGDITSLERYLAMLDDQLARHTFTIWNALTYCMRSILLVENGVSTGLGMMQDALDELRKVRFVTRLPAYLGRFAQALGDHGRTIEAHKIIEEALSLAYSHEERWCMPELLRLKGEIFLANGSVLEVAAAEACYREALKRAQEQEALSWELRAAMSQSRLWQKLGRKQEAYELISSTYGRFTEGFATRDLRTARALIDSVRL